MDRIGERFKQPNRNEDRTNRRAQQSMRDRKKHYDSLSSNVFAPDEGVAEFVKAKTLKKYPGARI